MAYKKTTWANNQAPAISSSNLNKIENGIEAVDTVVNNGWIPLTGTLTFVSFDSNTGIGVVGSNIDLTPYIGVGMKAKFTQNNAIKYAVITAITSTQITFFLGTSYSLNNSAITNTYFSMLKSPYGLPLEMVNDEYILQRDITTGNLPVKCGYKIDGKDVYVKRIYLGYLPNAGSKSVAHDITNFGLVVDIRGVMKDVSTGAQSKLPYVITSVSSSATQYFPYQIGFDVSDTNIIVYTGNDRTSNQAWVDLFFIYAS